MRKNFVAASLFFALIVLLAPAGTSAQISVGVSITTAPPALPVYTQPICPAAGFIWTPGYWSYGPAGYFWVPGTWVRAPRVGFLWTPGYWGWGGGVYAWHGGYWGPHVGFYGGVNYGFGYGGVGYGGGYWHGGVFAYNTSVNHVDVNVVHNTYSKTVINNTSVSRVSYNGGTGGTTARATASEESAAHENHIQPTSEQTRHEETAKNDRAQLASENHGRPSVAATPKAGEFKGAGVTGASHSEHAAKSEHAENPSHSSARSENASSNQHNVSKQQKTSKNGNSNGAHHNSGGAKHENPSHKESK